MTPYPIVDLDLVTLSEGARVVGTTKQALYKRLSSGTLGVYPKVQGSSVVLYSARELLEFWRNR